MITVFFVDLGEAGVAFAAETLTEEPETGPRGDSGAGDVADAVVTVDAGGDVFKEEAEEEDDDQGRDRPKAAWSQGETESVNIDHGDACDGGIGILE